MNLMVNLHNNTYFIFTIIILLCSLTSKGQNARWWVSFSAGSSLPVASYSAKDPSLSINYNYQPYPRFNGFIKEGNGAAQVGVNLAFEVGFQVCKNWELSASYNQTSNSVDVRPAELLLNQNTSNGLENKITQNDYRIKIYKLGFGYVKAIKRFRGGVKLTGGLAFMDHPTYKINLARPGSDGFDLYHFGVTPVCTSLTFGISVRLGYMIWKNISLSAGINYQKADFIYEANLRTVGSSGALNVADVVNYKVLEPAFILTYNF